MKRTIALFLVLFFCAAASGFCAGDEKAQSEPAQKKVLKPLIDSIKQIQDKDVDSKGYAKMMDSFSRENTQVSEEMARENLTMLYGAFESFRVKKGRYPKSIAELHNLLPQTVDPALVDKTKFGYKFGVLESGADKYVICANPVKNDPKYHGRFSYCVDEDLQIRVDPSGRPITDARAARKLPAAK